MKETHDALQNALAAEEARDKVSNYTELLVSHCTQSSPAQ